MKAARCMSRYARTAAGDGKHAAAENHVRASAVESVSRFMKQSA